MNFESNFSIYLFSVSGPEKNFSKLSEFLSYLKFNKTSPQHKFSYVGPYDGLIPELTINENILMNFNPDSLTTAREFQFQEFLGSQPNRALQNLYQMISTPHELPARTDAQMRKIASLIKSLVFEGQFIFLEEPEKDLENDTLILFIAAMKEHMALNKQNVFIFSSQIDVWMPHVQYIVKREKNFKFNTELISKEWQWKKDREQFYKASSPYPKESELIFKIPKHPKKSGRKKSAA